MASSPQPPSVAGLTKAVQVACVFVTSVASGGSLALSFLVVPRLLESPTPLMLRQWERTFYAGVRIFPGADLVASAGFLWLALSSPRTAASVAAAGVSPRTASLCYGLAGALAAGVVPYTILFMKRINNMLLRRAELTRGLAPTDEVAEPADEREGSKFLVDRWGVLNLGRSAMMLSAGLLGLGVSLW